MSGNGFRKFLRSLGGSSKRKVNSKGRQQGLKEGDLVLSINGKSTSEMTHAEAQKAVKGSEAILEMHVERRVPNAAMNGTAIANSWDASHNSVHVSHFNTSEEDTNHNRSWSTDSTSTGSTIIHVSPQTTSSEDQYSSSGTEKNMWSPSTRKKANLKLNCDLTARQKDAEESPQQINDQPSAASFQSQTKEQKSDETSPVWQPFGAPYTTQFRPVKLEVVTTTKSTTALPQTERPKQPENKKTEKTTKGTNETAMNRENTTSPLDVSKSTEIYPESLATSNASTTFVKSGWSSHLPPSQSPTITLLQKAREGQIPKGAVYIDEKSDSTPLPKNAVLIDQKVTIDGDKVHTDSYYAVPTLTTETTTHTIKAGKYDGIGPTECGIPVGLRTGVKEEYASDWYKTMYKSLHRGRYPGEPNQAVHFGGYMSEPEFDRKDVYRTKYSTTEHRKKPEKSTSYAAQTYATENLTKPTIIEPHVVRHEQHKYKAEPRSIAEYEPGRSSLAEKEFEKFWSDFWDSMDDLHEHLGSISPRPQQGLNRRWPNVLLSDGYESDSTLIRKTGRNLPQLDPEQQKAWYKEIQKGGEIPLIGLRKSAPEKPAETRSNRSQSPRVYGVEPPCFNHKHIPNSSPKPSFILRTHPVQKNSSISLQTFTMSTKRSAPIPPTRFSSRNMSILRTSRQHCFCGDNCKSICRDDSHSVSCCESVKRVCPSRNINSKFQSVENKSYDDNVLRRMKFYSSEDLFGLSGERDSSSYGDFHSVTNGISENYDCLHSPNICENMPRCRSSSRIDRKSRAHLLERPLSYPFSASFGSNNFGRTCCHSQQTDLYSDCVQNGFSCFCCKNFESFENKFLLQHFRNSQPICMETPNVLLYPYYKSSSDNVTMSPEISQKSIFDRPWTCDLIKMNNSSNQNELLPKVDEKVKRAVASAPPYSHSNNAITFQNNDRSTHPTFHNSVICNSILPFCVHSGLIRASRYTSLNQTDRNDYSNISSAVSSDPTSQSTNLEHNPLSKPNSYFEIDRSNVAESSHCQVKEIVPRNIYDIDNFNEKHPIIDVMRYNDCSVERRQVISATGMERNALNSGVHKSYSNKSLPRMISITPSVIKARMISHPHLAHSEAQVCRKHFCKVDINPLKFYLKGCEQYYQNVNGDHLKQKGYGSKVCINNRCVRNSASKNRAIQHSNERTSSFEYNKLLESQNIDLLPDSTQGNHTKVIPFIRRCDKISIKSLHNITRSSHFKAKILREENEKNAFLNENNAILYQQYIASLVQSIAKSRKFLHLKDFYTNLANVNNPPNDDFRKFNVIKIQKFDFSWGRVSSYRKWEKDRDRDLKIRHSSVEDLREMFQNLGSSKISKIRPLPVHLEKRWCNVSVTNLVEKYNNNREMRESLELRMSSEISSTKPKMKSILCSEDVRLKNISKYSVPFTFMKIPTVALSRYIGTSQCSSEHIKETTSFTPSISNSNSDIRIPHSSLIRKKVQYFERISQTNILENFHKYPYIPTIMKIGKFSNSRNLSWSDLRSLDNGCFSTDNHNVFSPQYLPEKAVSCLDLSFLSETSQTATEPSFSDSDHGWVSSTASCASQEDIAKRSNVHIRTIKTGTVARIKHKLEKAASLPRSQSVPHNIASMATRSGRAVQNSNLCSDGQLPNASLGSVQNLKHLFENTTTEISPNRIFKCSNSEISYKNSKWSSRYNGEISMKTSPKPNCECENISNACAGTEVRNEFSVEQYSRKRIRNLIARFEQSSYLDSSKAVGYGFEISHRYRYTNIYGKLNRNFCNGNMSNVKAFAELSILNDHVPLTRPLTGVTSETSPYQQGRIERFFKHASVQDPNAFYARNGLKYFPLVKNSSPKPYVKKAFNAYKPLKSCHPASPHQYQETEVNIHYRSPIRHLEKEYIEEEELRKRQEDAMRKFYEEERKKKHEQELAEIEMRRHRDFFTPSQKSPIPLNRYDNPFDTTNYGNRLAPPGMHRGPPPKTMARAIYPFTAQTTRELSLNKGDIVYITKQIDKNWYEGEHHGLIGIFPVTYVEIIPNEKANLQPRKALEGEALVKYNFRALTPVELSLFKGEKVVLTRRMDQNWYEGRLGTKKGIFPVSYVNVLQEPGESKIGSRAISPKPPASPVYSPIVNGSPAKMDGPTFNTGLRPLQDKPPLNVDRIDNKSSLTQSLHIDTYNEPIPYRSLYSYKPQNDDELELKEGDTVYVMEKCDDGWYVGTSLRTGLFGTFPGNYVERI